MAVRAIDVALGVYALAFICRLALGPLQLDLWFFEVSFTHYSKPLRVIAVLLFVRLYLSDSAWWSAFMAGLRRWLPSWIPLPDGLVHFDGGRPPTRLALMVVAMVYAIVIAFAETVDHYDFTPFWSDPVAGIFSPASEVLGERFGDAYRLVEEIRQTLPVDAAILLETDERPYFVNYYLYPRRVYMHSSAVALLERRSTYHPDIPVELHPHPPEEVCPLLSSRAIGWRVYYYPNEPERSRIERIASPLVSEGGS